jgi:formylglycine-generating enzyme required for sulfatase activity
VGKFSVTVDEFAAFVKATGYEAPGCNMENHSGFMPGRGTWRSPGFPQTGSHPAVCLNWNDAKAYTAWLSKVTGNTYRLLTEAEWEYAARAGSTTLYFFGDDANELCNYGNGKDLTATTEKHQEFSGVACNDGFVYTAPSGSFKPNAFGLYDMIGNASQWVEDCKSANYQGVPDDGSAVEFPSCDYRTQRGGSWNNVPWYYHSANREAAKPDNRFNTYGLRVAREPKRRGTKLDLWPKGGV